MRACFACRPVGYWLHNVKSAALLLPPRRVDLLFYFFGIGSRPQRAPSREDRHLPDDHALRMPRTVGAQQGTAVALGAANLIASKAVEMAVAAAAVASPARRRDEGPA
jgi:hypothetical protein